jgi:hypothetical protein
MGMNVDDELLVAWLVKQRYQVMNHGHITWLIKQNAIAHPEPITVETLGMWVAGGTGTSPWKTRLYRTQRGKRRPLRSAVREWMFGI